MSPSIHNLILLRIFFATISLLWASSGHTVNLQLWFSNIVYSMYFKWRSLSASAFFGLDRRLSNIEVTQHLWLWGFWRKPLTKSTCMSFKTQFVYFGCNSARRHLAPLRKSLRHITRAFMYFQETRISPSNHKTYLRENHNTINLFPNPSTDWYSVFFKPAGCHLM